MNDKKSKTKTTRIATTVGRKLKEAGVIPMRVDIVHVDWDGKGELYCPDDPPLTAAIITLAKQLDPALRPPPSTHIYKSGQFKHRPELDMDKVNDLIRFIKKHPNQIERLTNAMYRIRDLVDKTEELEALAKEMEHANN